MNGCGFDALWWLSHAELVRGLQRVPVNSLMRVMIDSQLTLIGGQHCPC